MSANVPALLVRILLFYAVVCLAAYLFQNRLLYHPVRLSAEQAAAHATTRGLAPWPAGAASPDGGGVRAFLRESATDETRGTVLVFHGNAGTALDRQFYAHALGRLGYRVLLAEYPGYGARPGETSESSFVADALETVRLAHAEFGPPLYLWGESLGAAVAAGAVAGLAARDAGDEVAGVAMITPWDTLPNLAQRIYWFLPARWLARDRYDNVANLRAWSGPVAVAYAAEDRVVSNRFARSLHASLPEPKRLWVFDRADHNDWPSAPGEPWWAEVAAFLEGGGAPPEARR
jgi:pimeloyl-ACP methyl ester carboxylesterase